MTTAFILLGVGMLAIFVEFFLPGGIFGAIGAVFLLASIALVAVNSDSLLFTVGYVIVVGVVVAFLVKFALWRIVHGKPGHTVYHDADQEGFQASAWDRSLVGKTAIVSTDLRPGGHVTINNKSYSAISQSGYISKGSEVTVIGGEGETLIVKSQIKGNGS